MSAAALVRIGADGSIVAVDTTDPSRSEAAILSCSTGWSRIGLVSAGARISDVTLVRSGWDATSVGLGTIASTSVVEPPKTAVTV